MATTGASEGRNPQEFFPTVFFFVSFDLDFTSFFFTEFYRVWTDLPASAELSTAESRFYRVLPSFSSSSLVGGKKTIVWHHWLLLIDEVEQIFIRSVWVFIRPTGFPRSFFFLFGLQTRIYPQRFLCVCVCECVGVC